MPGPPSSATGGNGGNGGGNGGSGRTGGGRGNRKSSGSKVLLDSLREACPVHKLKDLEELVKSLKGDEAKIREKISEWWDEPPAESEGDWEDVNKKNSAAIKHATPPAKFHKAGGRGRGSDFSGGRGRSGVGGPARGYSSGRGGRDGRGRGRAGERGGSHYKQQQHDSKPEAGEESAAVATVTDNQDTVVASPPGVPTSGNTRAPLGAWAKRNVEQQPDPVVVHERHKTEPVAASLLSSIDVAMPQDIAPPPMSSPPVPTLAPVSVNKLLAAPTGNVWAIRGSAHLIQAEKPAPPPPQPSLSSPNPIVAPPPISRKSNGSNSRKGGDRGTSRASSAAEDPLISSAVDAVASLTSITPRTHDIVPALPPVEVVVAPPLPTPQIPQAAPAPPAPGLSAPSSSMGWNHQEKTLDTVPQHQQQQPPAPVAPTPVVPESMPKVEVRPTPSVRTATTAATTVSVLNMGRWETADADDSLDFGFGSFGTDTKTIDGVDTVTDSTPATAASPARPPPGLSITGMPPMPTNAVLVHELENKLEDVSVSKQHHHQQQGPDSTGIGSLAPASHQLPHNIHQPHISMHDSHLTSQQQPMYGANQYGSGGGMGMYGNYNVGGASGGHAFMNMPGSGVGPGIGQPHQGPHTKGPSLPPQQQPGLYNPASTPSNAPVVGATAGVAGNEATGGPNNTNNATGGMPPGMPGMPYGNPMYYGQQQFHMGQHQPGIGYNYGYGGQFGGGVQGGFGYPGGMHGNAGYGHGGPQYDDHTGVGANPTSHGSLGSGGVGGYNPQQPQNQAQQGQQSKNSGSGNAGAGYRGGGGGRHNNNNNQYQQYTPQPQHLQHAGYGGPPYGMGYHGDHFNQRGGYQNMQDPYGMPQQQPPGVGNYGGSSFQGDNQYKGKKNNNRAGLNQFQQQGPQNQQAPTPQAFGLHGQGVADANQQTTDGWTNQGGWSGGGGSGATSGWQGAK